MADVRLAQIEPIARERMIVPIVGMSPLLVHRFSEKAKRIMLETTQGKKKQKQPKDPEQEFRDAAYRTADGGYGFPSVGFKSCIVSAARFYPKTAVTMTGLRQLIFIKGEIGSDDVALTPILPDGDVEGEWPTMREDAVRVGTGSDLRYRPQFWPWRAELDVTYMAGSITRGSVLSLIEAAGAGVGVGDWRPEKSGDFGTFRVDAERGVKVW